MRRRLSPDIKAGYPSSARRFGDSLLEVTSVGLAMQSVTVGFSKAICSDCLLDNRGQSTVLMHQSSSNKFSEQSWNNGGQAIFPPVKNHRNSSSNMGKIVGSYFFSHRIR